MIVVNIVEITVCETCALRVVLSVVDQSSWLTNNLFSLFISAIGSISNPIIYVNNYSRQSVIHLLNYSFFFFISLFPYQNLVSKLSANANQAGYQILVRSCNGIGCTNCSSFDVHLQSQIHLLRILLHHFTLESKNTTHGGESGRE